MKDERIVRAGGECVRLEDREYEISSVEGYGGSTVVYRAFYRDCLIEGQKHWVLIKELYPRTSDHSIYRNEQGIICWEDDGDRRRSKDRFCQANEVNLKLLEDHPSQIPGNLINCEAYGTYYSVLPLQGGETLQRSMEAVRKFTLRDIVMIMKEILESLRPFHDRRLLYLDISPDNILIFHGWAMLIDFDSVWDLDRLSQESHLFSKKEGYTAPEIYLPEERASVGFATDLYSVCAVFFELLTGTRTDEVCGLLSSATIYRALEESPVFQREPETAFLKTAEILIKGLDASASGRYQNISNMMEQLDELILRIDHKGVSHSVLWECSKMAWKKPSSSQSGYIDQDISVAAPNRVGAAGSTVTSLRGLTSMLIRGTDILLTGPGGMGKTRLLTELAGMFAEQYRPDMPVFFYIALGEYQKDNNKVGYIRKQLMRRLNFSEQIGNMSDMEHELDLLLDQKKNNQVNLVLLLDGLNEAKECGKNLIPEIEELSRRRGISILMTDRTDVTLQYALSEFRSAELKPLSNQAVQSALKSYHVHEPGTPELKELLRNPLMLELYIKIAALEREGGDKQTQKETILTVDDLVRLYLDNQLAVMQRSHHGDRAAQMRDAYIMTHVLPAVAKKMGTKYLISGTELTGVLRKSYERLKQDQFRERFPEYRNDIDQMLGEWTEDRWYGYVVNQLLNCALLFKCADDSYRLFHDNMKGYLMKRADENEDMMGMTAAEIQEAFLGIGEFLIAAYGLAVMVGNAFDMFKAARKAKAEAAEKEAAGYTRISYFLNATEIYGVPTGIHPIKASDLDYMNTYLEFRTSGDRGEDIQVLRFQKGTKVRDLFSVAWDSSVQSLHLPDCGTYNGEPCARSVYVEAGNIRYQQQYDETFLSSDWGPVRNNCLLREEKPVTFRDLNIEIFSYKRKNISRIEEYYSDKGYTRYMMFLEEVSGEKYAADCNDMAGIEYWYDEQGKKTAELFVNAEKQRIMIDGINGVGFIYDKKDNLTIIGYINADGNMINGWGGWAYCRQAYDCFHNVIKMEYYDQDDHPAVGPEGAFKILMMYKKGCVISTSYYNLKSKLCRSRMGYAQEELVYEHGVLTSRKFLDERKKLCECEDGYAMETIKLFRYKEGQCNYYAPQEISFWNSEKKICVNTSCGAARIEYEYDENGELLKESAYGADGSPCTLKEPE